MSTAARVFPLYLCVVLAGSGGGSSSPVGSATLNTSGSSAIGGSFPSLASLADYHSPAVLLALINQAGSSDYATLGEAVLAAGHLEVVAPPTLPTDFNAYTFLPDGLIWISTLMYSRYPAERDQAYILLHELVHLKTGNVDHTGPEWAVLDQFQAVMDTLQPRPATSP